MWKYSSLTARGGVGSRPGGKGPPAIGPRICFKFDEKRDGGK